MKICVIGGGPAGLYFSILMKKRDPSSDIVVYERNPADQTFGWGVVFSDETLGNLLESDSATHEEITRTFAHWDSIDIHLKGQCLRSSGHGFSGISRQVFLRILQRRAAQLGVRVEYQSEITELPDPRQFDLFVGADGVKSRVRQVYEDVFKPNLDFRRCRYIWLGTHKLFDAFTFLFEETKHGIFQIHAYRFDDKTSTFIAECDEETWKRAGLDTMSPEDGAKYLEEVFAKYLDGNKLLLNKSTWINFVTVKNESWRHGNVVLLGDAAHTAHFSIGSGTKLALEDAIELAGALEKHPRDVTRALEVYETERRSMVERTQKAAQDSLLWFENTKRYWRLEPIQFAFSLLTRSKRIGFDNLRVRDPGYTERVTKWFAQRNAEALQGVDTTPPKGPYFVPARSSEEAPPPMFTPFRLREMTLQNRVVVSPMAMYSACDGTPDDFHLVHLGGMALGGAGVITTEMTCVSAEGRITPGCAGLYAPEHTAAWKRIVSFVHGRSAAKISLQLGHSGRKGSTRVGWEGSDVPLPSGNWPLVSASAIAWRPENQTPRAATREDMIEVREQFVRSAKAGLECGFDMLELHMAHGYLLASFISPLTNRRDDEYGGSLQNRLRFPIEVFDAVREIWPKDRPMSVRISACDWADGGLEEEEAVQIGRMFKERGCDILHVSTGQTVPHAKPVFGRMWQTRFSDAIRNEAGIPTIAVGNIMSADQVNTIIASGRADLCALARPHLLNPHWTMAAAAEQNYPDVPWAHPYNTVIPRRKQSGG